MRSRVVVGYVLKRFPRLSETFILRELLQLEQLGIEAVVFALGRADDPEVNADYARLKAQVVYVDDTPPMSGFSTAETDRYARLARRLEPFVRAAGVSHLHAHFATSAADVAARLSRTLRIPFSVTAHAKDIFHDSVSDDDLRRLAARAAFIVTVSDYNVRHLQRIAGGDTPIYRIYNGVDLTTLPMTRPAMSRPRDVLAIGRFVEKKGFDVFIDAIARLQRSRPQLHATLIGGGRCDAALRARAAERGLSTQLAMPGPLSQRLTLDAMRTHSVLAAPCVVGPDGDRDGLPTVIIEAMALGLPVVATPVTGIPEIVQHGHTGLLVPERDPSALALAIERLLDDPALRADLASRARQVVERDFDLQINTRALADLFRASVSPAEPARASATEAGVR